MMVRAAAIAEVMALVVAGAAHAASNRQVYPYPKAALYQALLDELRAEKRKIKIQDQLIGRVSASAGMSAMSWGENLSFTVVKTGPSSSAIEYAGARKAGTNVIDGGRGFQIFDKVALGVSCRLQADGAPPADAPPPAQEGR